MASKPSTFTRIRPYLPWMVLGSMIVLMFLLRGLSVHVGTLNFYFG